MKIKEISRENLGIPCKWDVTKCPYFKNGIDYNGNKLDCSIDYGYRCNGGKIKVIYEIDGDKYGVIESKEFSKPLKDEIDVDMSKEHLINEFKKGRSLNFILMWNSIRNEYK